jgi:sugar O-acyltransferase (sialic acid O-acetyltransferase NeuD family)
MANRLRSESAHRVQLAVFGGKGSGQLTVDTVRRITRPPGVEVIGYLNDREPAGAQIGGVPVLGPFDAWAGLPPNVMFAAPLHAHNDMLARVARIESLGIPDRRWIAVIDPASLFLGEVAHGVACFVGAFSVTKAGVRLGRHVAVRELASIGHDSDVDDFAFVGTRAVISGYCRIGRGAYVAAGAIVRDRITVGEFATIGMGAVVTRDVADRATVIGHPARPVGRGGNR